MASFEDLVAETGGAAEAPQQTPVQDKDVSAFTSLVGGGGEEQAASKIFEPRAQAVDKDISSFEGLVNESAQATWPEVFKAVPPMVGASLRQTAAGALQAQAELGREPDEVQAPVGAAEALAGFFGLGKPAMAGTEADIDAMDAILSHDPLMGGAPPMSRVVREAAVQKGQEIGERARKDLREATPSNMSFWQEATLTAGVSAGHVGAVAVPAFLTRSPGLVATGMGLMEASRSYDEARSEGLDPGPAMRLSVLKGMLEGGTEFLPAKALLKNDTLFKKFANFMMKEIPGENIAEVGQLFADYLYGLEDDVTVGDIARTMALTSAATLITGGATVPIVRAGEKLGVLPGEQREVVETFEEDRADDTKPVVVREDARPAEPGPAAPPDTGIEVRETLTAEEETEMIALLKEQAGTFPEPPTDLPASIPANLPVEQEVALRQERANALEDIIEREGNKTVAESPEVTDMYDTGRLIRHSSDRPAADQFSTNMQEVSYSLPISHSADASQVGKTVQDAKLRPGQVVEAWDLGRSAQERAKSRTVMNTINSWVKEFIPEAKVVLTDNKLMGRMGGRTGTGTGWAGWGRDGTLFLSYDPAQNPEQLYALAAHEFGHTIINQEWKNAPSTTKKALLNSYKEYLNDVVNAPFSTWLSKWSDPATTQLLRDRNWGVLLDNPAMTTREAFDKISELQGKNRSSYFLNFDEFSAQQFVRYATSREKVFGSVERFWKKIYDKLRKFFTKRVKRYQPHLTFEAWYEQLSELGKLRTIARDRAPTLRETNQKTFGRETGLERPLRSDVFEPSVTTPNRVKGDFFHAAEFPEAADSISKHGFDFNRIGQSGVSDILQGVWFVTSDRYVNHATPSSMESSVKVRLNTSKVKYFESPNELFRFVQDVTGISDFRAAMLSENGPRAVTKALRDQNVDIVAFGRGFDEGRTPYESSSIVVINPKAIPRAKRVGKPTNENRIESVAQRKIDKSMQELNMDIPQVRVDDPASYSTAKYNKFVKQTFTLLQLMKENAHIPGMTQYAEAVRSWWADKTRWTSRADQRLKQWHVPKAKETAFNKAVFELTLQSFQEERKLTDAEKLDIFREQGITDPELIALYEKTQEDFNLAVREMFEVRRAEAFRELSQSPALRDEKLAELNTQEQELLNREYYPLTRFGSFYVRVVAKRPMRIQGQSLQAGDTIAFEMFEREGDMKKRVKQLGRSNEARSVIPGKISDEVKPFIGMPEQIVDSMAEKLQLTDAQREQLGLIKFETSPAQSFVKHMLRRKGVRGFNMDSRRVYANYFMHFANHIARMKHAHPLSVAKGRVEDHAIRRGKAPDVSNVKEQGLSDHLTRHYDYIMNPGNELANLRSLGFLWYLGYMPKSAFVNLTQVPLVTFPFLSSRYGSAQTTTELTKAMKDIRRAFQTVNGVTTGLEEDLRRAITRGTQAGFLDESFATDLAAMAEGSNLQRLLPGSFLGSEKAASTIRTMSHYGAWMFQKAEKFNRVQTFTAAYRLSKKQALGDNRFEDLPLADQNRVERQAFIDARDAVESTQYEYARWNRPELFRGKKSVVFLFMQYLQNTLYFALRDKGAARFWIAMLLLGGIQGIPGAEDFLDMFDWSADWVKRLTGWSNAKTDAREWMRDMAEEIGVNPDYTMHGLSRHSFGLPWLGDAAGVPVPNFDLSGSLSMGRILPGLEPALNLTSPTGDFKSEFPNMVTDVGGAFVSIPMSILQAIADDNPDTFKRWERAMPSVARSISKAYRYATTQAETSRSGAEIVEFDPHNRIHNAEILGQALGFRPTRVAQRQERDWVKREHARYYEVRRRQLFQDFDYALRIGDREALADVRKAIIDYNNNLPVAGLRITGEELNRGIKARAKARRLEELGLPRSRKMVPLYRSLEEATDVVVEDAP